MQTTESVRSARDAYLAENGWPVEAYDAPTTEATVFGISVQVPNTAKHRWGIQLHDLHHVATGYGTDLVGEGEVSAFEVRGGLAGLGPYVGSIVFLGMVLGFFVAPRRTWQAFRDAAPARNLFRDPASYEELLALDVKALRARLGVGPGGLARHAPGLHARAPATLLT